VVVIDTDVLLLDLAYPRDKRFAVNAAFLARVVKDDAALTIYNLMELLGQLSFNLAPARLDAWQTWLIDAYQLTVIWPIDPTDPAASAFFRVEIFERPYAKMRAQRMAFVDALILNLAERTPNVDCFVTWNAKHFKSKSPLRVYTPEEYVNRKL
jgi:hypothetical protein